MTRRRFIKIAGTTVALASVPMAVRAARGARPAPAAFGGPTPNDDFYVTSYSRTPRVDPAAWRLSIKGLVANPFELTLGQVKSLPELHERATMECISNPPDGNAIGTADWVGTKVKPLLERAKIDRRAVNAVMRGADGFHTGVPIEEIVHGDNFFAYTMNGVPLPPDHGFPLRIIIPGKYGMKQPKWITEIEFVERPHTGYWEARGWSNEAWRKVNSGFFSPRPATGLFGIFDRTAHVTAPAEIWGWALAGPAGIKGVDVSFDDGKNWSAAEIVDERGYNVWTVWRYRFAPQKPGEYVIRARATDGDGVAQPRSDPQTGSGQSGQAVMAVTVTAA